MDAETTKRKPEILAKVLAALAALLASFILLELAGWRMLTARADAQIERALDSENPQPRDLAPFMAQTQSLAKELKEKNLFVLKPPPRNPVREVVGILGAEALINGKWYKAGDRVGDARVVAVGPTRVRIAWNGNETVFAPIGASGAGASGRRGAPPRPAPGPAGTGVSSGRGRPSAPRNPLMSAEERSQLRQRWKTMSSEERQNFREEMRQRVRGRSR
jgi:hypothetical protein